MTTQHCQHAADILTDALLDRCRIATELLVAGVAFQRTGTRWDVYSHDGNHIGELSTFMVCHAGNALKRTGLKSAAVTDVNAGEQPSVTFGHFHPDLDERDAIMTRRSRRFCVVH